MHGEARGSTSVFNLEPFDGIKCSFPRSGGMEILGWLWQLGAPAAAAGSSGLRRPRPLTAPLSRARSEGRHLSPATGATGATTACGTAVLAGLSSPDRVLGFVCFFLPFSSVLFTLLPYRSVSLSFPLHFSFLFRWFFLFLPSLPFALSLPLPSLTFSSAFLIFAVPLLTHSLPGPRPPSPPGAAPAHRGGLPGSPLSRGACAATPGPVPRPGGAPRAALPRVPGAAPAV